MKIIQTLRYLILCTLLNGISFIGSAATKTVVSDGNWNSSGTWFPSGVPATDDSVIVPNNKILTLTANATIQAIYISAGGMLICNSGKTLTMTGSLHVYGTFTMNTSEIIFAAGKSVTIGNGGTFEWNPQTNTAAAATLFTNGIENFATGSTLIIKKWYDYSVPLGSVVSGNFGNLVLNSKAGSTINEWRQQNQFSAHQITGTLTVDEGWIVLDKSGSITSTTIGNIELLNSNSYLDFHGGDHSGSFTVNTGNITLNDGSLNGIYNGNGNVTLNVSGDFLVNKGLHSLVMNDGVAAKGKGNANLNVSGNYTQNNGSFYGIYNLTATGAGVSEININGHLNFTGGTFMAHYACHTGNGVTTLRINGNTSIDFPGNSSKFRIAGLSTISSTNNTIRCNWINYGNVSISGNTGAEFTSSAASGTETDSLYANLNIDGGETGFNWGASASQSHLTTIYIGGNMNVSRGSWTGSWMNHDMTGKIAGDLNISGGTVVLKKETGNVQFTIEGNYNQTNGDFLFHDNHPRHTPDSITVTISGNFSQSKGSLEFDNNTSVYSATHHLYLTGANYTISGTGDLTRKNSGSNTRFGILHFARQGTMTFKRSGANHLVSNIKQVVESGCTLDIQSGDFQISTHSITDPDYLKIRSGSILEMNTNQIYGAGVSIQTGVYVEAGGILRTKNINGFYDGTSNACLKAANGTDFWLDSLSIIEYNGVDNQVITGLGQAVVSGNQHKYGILKINFDGTPDNEFTYLKAGYPVFVRHQLDLTKGELSLNGQTLTLENGAGSAVSRIGGYVKSETPSAINTSIFKWKNMHAGEHEFPFGVNSTSYIPVLFNLKGGAGTDVSASTRATSLPDNKPWAGTSNVAAVYTMSGGSSADQSVTHVIDRWWNFIAPSVTADVTVSYRGAENTVNASERNGQFGVQSWDGTQWRSIQGSGNGVTSGIGTVTVPNAGFFSPWVVVSASSPLPIELVFFKAKLNNDVVDLTWATAAEVNNNFFSIERSQDGQRFEVISTHAGAGNSTRILNYSSQDPNPLKGYNYYRLKQTDYDGQYSYSEIQTVKYKAGNNGDDDQLEIVSCGPNPFSGQFSLAFMIKKPSSVNISMINSGGQVVHTEEMLTNDGINTFNFNDDKGLEKGIYFLIIQYNDQKITKKMIKN